MQVSTTHYVAWILTGLLHVCIAVIMYRRSLIKQLPWFFAFTIYHIVQFVVLFVSIKFDYSLYFYSFWISEGVDCLMALAVIQEVYQNAFRPFDGLKTFASLVFKWAALLLIVIAIATALANNGSERDRFIAALLILDRSAAFVQCGLLFLIFLLKQAMGLNWSQPSTGIALGMGIASASVTVALTVRAYSGGADDAIVGLMMALFYNVALFIWVAALLRPDREPGRGQLPGDEVLEKWNSALVEIMGR